MFEVFLGLQKERGGGAVDSYSTLCTCILYAKHNFLPPVWALDTAFALLLDETIPRIPLVLLFVPKFYTFSVALSHSQIFHACTFALLDFSCLLIRLHGFSQCCGSGSKSGSGQIQNHLQVRIEIRIRN
jgi:hypothetical protein